MTGPNRMESNYMTSTVWFTTETPGWWTEDAQCRRYPQLADLFTEAQTFGEADVAFSICAECPVRAECLVLGRRLGADGVWGGQLLRRGTPQRRTPERRRRASRSEAAPAAAEPRRLRAVKDRTA